MRKTQVFLVGSIGLALALTIVTLVVWLQPMFSSAPGVRSTGTALVGGPFTLTDHTGKRVTEKDFEGTHTLIYFGYTFCPDVCPGELQVMAAALDELGEKANKIQPVFITVDPERDTPEHLADYVENFHDRLIGLTGSKDDIEQVAKAYRVYYAKVNDAEASDYLMDHSSILYLMGPDGAYLTHFGFGVKPKDMAEKLSQYLG